MKVNAKKILVTGADGFIGSHLVERLVSLGCQVKALVLYNSFNFWGWLDALPEDVKNSIEVCMGDVRDPFNVKHVMQDCDVVMHLASLIAIPYSYHAPASYVDTNITGTLNVFQAARELNVDQVIHTSTSEVYGTAKYVPIDEQHPLQGQSPYAASKIAADQLALSFHSSFNVPVTIVRPFNTYGPRQSARAVIPASIIQIANNQTSIKLGNLHPTRDFNYIDDTVSAFIAAIKNPKTIGQVMNVGSNFEISIKDTVDLIASLMGKDIVIEQQTERVRPGKSEVERLYACNEKSRQLLGWQPDYPGVEGLKNGLQKTIAWFSQPENMKLYKAGMYAI